MEYVLVWGSHPSQETTPSFLKNISRESLCGKMGFKEEHVHGPNLMHQLKTGLVSMDPALSWIQSHLYKIRFNIVT